MYKEKNRPAPSKNEPSEIMTFNFSESKDEIRNVFVNGEPFFIGSDVANALGYKNSRKALKDHCKGVTKRYTLTNGGKQLMSVIPESDVYRLIISSTLPKAQEFERWLMEEVLPSLRKKGYYSTQSYQKGNFTDARALPFEKKEFNKIGVRCVAIEGKEYFSVSDINNAIHSRTCAAQTAKKLNVVQPFAQKIWLFGATHPAWFTCILGFKLIVSGSRVFNSTNQLILEL